MENVAISVRERTNEPAHGSGSEERHSCLGRIEEQEGTEGTPGGMGTKRGTPRRGHPTEGNLKEDITESLGGANRASREDPMARASGERGEGIAQKYPVPRTSSHRPKL